GGKRALRAVSGNFGSLQNASLFNQTCSTCSDLHTSYTYHQLFSGRSSLKLKLRTSRDAPSRHFEQAVMMFNLRLEEVHTPLPLHVCDRKRKSPSALHVMQLITNTLRSPALQCSSLQPFFGKKRKHI
ncbi:hypothetical protein SRHO_G00220560, partial [Serrasalmus rhombeus]